MRVTHSRSGVRFNHEIILLILELLQKQQEINIDPMNVKQNMNWTRVPGAVTGTVRCPTHLEVWSWTDSVKIPAGGAVVSFSSEETMPSTARRARLQFLEENTTRCDSRVFQQLSRQFPVRRGSGEGSGSPTAACEDHGGAVQQVVSGSSL